MKLTETAKREKEFHEKRYLDGLGLRGLVSKAYIAYQFAVDDWTFLTKATKSRVLEIGCSIGINRAKKYKEKECSYTGIDISENCIKKNKDLAKSAGLDVEYIFDDGNSLNSIKGRKFDLIFMNGVLHHLDYDVVLPTLKSLLDKNGKIIMLEPLKTNPLINLFRTFTPKLRTIDEHPLNFNDLQYIKKFFPGTRFKLHCIFSMIMIPFALFLSEKILFKFYRPLGKLDLLFTKIPLIKRLSWLVLIEAKY